MKCCEYSNWFPSCELLQVGPHFYSISVIGVTIIMFDFKMKHQNLLCQYFCGTVQIGVKYLFSIVILNEFDGPIE